MSVKLDYFPFSGGINEETPPMMVPSGQAFFARNYEPDINGGYRRAGGYERFDGHPRPSDADYVLVACTLTTTPAVGAVVTIGAATARFVQVVPGGALLTAVSGTIPTGTSMTVAGSPVGTTAADLTLEAPQPKLDAEYQLAARNVVRADIGVVPGSGPVRGVWIFGSDVYAVRDNAGATAGVLHKATPTGWQAVALGEVVAFSNANTGVNDGDTLTQGGVTATVARVVLETGSLASGTNTGRLVLTGRSGGSFAAGAATTTGGALTLGGAQVAQALPAGGRYQFCNYNFFGQQSGLRMYGANGVGRAFEFDGSVFVSIRTGAAEDKPTRVVGHRRYLFVAQGSSVMNSSIGDPYRWVASEGAGEIATGDTVTDIVSLPGEALGIMGRNSSAALTGASPADWSLQVIRSDVGALPYTVAVMSDTYLLDDKGITSVATSDTYGNFIDAVLSRTIQKTVSRIKPSVVGAYVNRTRGHYVLMSATGEGIVMGVAYGKITGFTTVAYPVTPTCLCSGEDGSGVERYFMGAADGLVYELNRGRSFDGEAIEAFVKIHFAHSKSPRVRKRYRRVVLDLENEGYTELSFLPEFSYAADEIAVHRTQAMVANGNGGSWDLDSWDGFIYDGQTVISQPNLSVEGTGLNLAMIFYSRSAIDAGHVLQGAMVHYTPRRLER